MSKKQRQKEKRKLIQKRKAEGQESLAEKGMEALKRKVQSGTPFGNRKVVFQASSGEKMSETLLAFLEPFQKDATTQDAFERLVAVGATAWNAALFPQDKRKALIDEISKAIEESAGKEGAEVYRDLINELIKRKERYFANNKRLIASYEVTGDKGNFHLAVASIV